MWTCGLVAVLLAAEVCGCRELHVSSLDKLLTLAVDEVLPRLTAPPRWNSCKKPCLKNVLVGRRDFPSVSTVSYSESCCWLRSTITEPSLCHVMPHQYNHQANCFIITELHATTINVTGSIAHSSLVLHSKLCGSSVSCEVRKVAAPVRMTQSG